MENMGTSEDVISQGPQAANSDEHVQLDQSVAPTSEESQEKPVHVDATLPAQAGRLAGTKGAEDVVTWASSSTPSAARLKWCGCLASSPCSHFTNYYTAAASSHFCAPPSSTLFTSHQLHPTAWTSTPHSLHQILGTSFHPTQHYSSLQHDLKQLSKLKAQILSHPMYDQLLSAHVACLRVATPVDHLQTIEAQLSTSVQHVAARYKSFFVGDQLQSLEEKEDLDRFMANYIVFLHSFKEQLHEHVRVQAMDAVMSCWEIEKAFVNLTGVSPGEGSGATMSDDEEERVNAFMDNINSIDFLEGIDSLGLGPLLPTESERSLMERVRLELKSELKQGYKNRIADVREEILRKRRAGKLPSETTAILKKWWNAHSKWPYPTEDEKARLVQETGLELKQINNWFINQRKRNWHSHASTTSTTLSKNESSTPGNGGGQSSSVVSLSLNCEGEKAQNYLQDPTQNALSSVGDST